MKKQAHLLIPFTVCILFYWISRRSYTLQAGELEGVALFSLFMGISNLIAFFVPLVLSIFYMLTSWLMFGLLDETYCARKLAFALSVSFIPVILNCLIFLAVLYGIHEGGTFSEMAMQRPIFGLGIMDMERVGYLFWGGFYLFFILLIRHEFEMGFLKATGIALLPTVMVVMGRFLLSII